MSELLTHIANARDRAAFEELFHYFAPRIKGYLLNTRLSSEQAEDIAQETMLKVWRKAHLFDAKKASASTWIFTIARNLRVDTLRKINKPELDPNDPMHTPTQDPQADELSEQAERDRLIYKALATLPDKQKQVVQLFFFHDDPHTEIARKLDIPLGTVKSRLRLAFGKIRKELGTLE